MSPKFDYCPSLAEFDLTANVSPSDGTSAYTIDGLSRTKLNPSALSTGKHTVNLTYTDLKGCIAKAATQEVTINAVPSITTQPIGSTVCFGTEILLSVIATGKDGTSSAMDLTYAWKKVGSNTALSNSKNYTFIPSVLEAGQYFV